LQRRRFATVIPAQALGRAHIRSDQTQAVMAGTEASHDDLYFPS
jgi:hypothetical protein